MPQMKEVIEALTEYGIRTESKIMVGDAPVTHEFADPIEDGTTKTPAQQ
ncbi:MAG: hypothetical protein LBU65_17335 [Planctomycetaceae bacterium]|jgi:methanogenic corrinoid protein MtbC1|nr:hypothetical protein [Planctomycetaceae bacterium]